MNDLPKNPCRYCDKANIELIGELEYGCDEPCQKAEDFFGEVGKEIDKLLNRVNELLKGGADE
jgi:hypothetical protein